MIVVNSSKKASTHMCTVHQRQKSAITKLVSGRATKEAQNIRMMPETE